MIQYIVRYSLDGKYKSMMVMARTEQEVLSLLDYNAIVETIEEF